MASNWFGDARTGGTTHAEVGLLDELRHLDEQAGGERSLLDLPETVVQGLPVAQHLLGLGAGGLRLVRRCLEQLVVRRQDVFDL